MESQLIILDTKENPDVLKLRKKFDDLWNDQDVIIVFLLGEGDGFDKIAENLDGVACNFPTRRGIWLKQPEKIVPEKVQELSNNDPKIILSSVGFDRNIGSWRTFAKAQYKQEIDNAFNEATERDGAA